MTAKLIQILLIEDNPAHARLFTEFLGETNPGQFEIVWEQRLQGGISQLENKVFDVVLLDLTLPDSKGIETCKQALSQSSGVPIVILTGTEDEDLGIAAIELGAQDYIVKGQLNSRSLARSVRYAIERHARQVAETKLLAREEEIRVANLKQTFIEVASHELRTPLTILNGMTQLLRRKGGLDPDVLQSLSLIERAGLRLDRIVDQMLKMLMKGSLSGLENRVPTNINALVHEIGERVAPFIAIRKQTLRIETADGFDELCIDRNKIQDSISNLLINAIKFTPDDGTITINSRQENDCWKISIVDTGMGIEPEALPHVFDAFFTGFDTTNHTSGLFEYGAHGLGLGLTLVRLFVDMHDGEITVDSTHGEGSTFTVILPITKA